MTTDRRAQLAQHFPTPEDIPAEHRLAEQVHQRHSLIAGRMIEWGGPCKTVLSPICTRDASTGEVRQVEIGSYPVMGEAESDAALDAAVAAYANGRGAWPTMAVAERIACMQEFVRLMAQQRELIVKLIMWEIGKSLADSRKEFDRTVEYIQATIEALKDLDNGSSRFVVAEGTSSNVFVVQNGILLATPKNNLVLPGITYDVVLELAQAHGLAHEARPVSEQEVRAADEIWVTSSTKEVLAVTSFDGKPVGSGKPGSLFRRIYQYYQDFKRTVMRQAA